MKIGRLYARLDNSEALGDHFVIDASNMEGPVFEVSGDKLKLRLTVQTAIRLAQFIDETVTEDLKLEFNTKGVDIAAEKE